VRILYSAHLAADALALVFTAPQPVCLSRSNTLPQQLHPHPVLIDASGHQVNGAICKRWCHWGMGHSTVKAHAHIGPSTTSITDEQQEHNMQLREGD
jgi:hypothetical protein